MISLDLNAHVSVQRGEAGTEPTYHLLVIASPSWSVCVCVCACVAPSSPTGEER
jgi:hypothetical protein